MNSSNYVPNKFPTLQHQVPYRIAFIGEAPGADEVVGKTPFIGVSGRWLDYLLNRVNILRSACYLGNVSQHQPPGNKLYLFPWDGPEIQNGIQQLHADIEQFNPNLCVLLGATALRAAKGYVESISNWRGSMFIGAAGGIAASDLPGLSLVPAVAMGIGAMCAVMLGLPLTATLLATLLLGIDGLNVMPLVIVAVVVAYVTSARLGPAPAAEAGGPAQAEGPAPAGATAAQDPRPTPV